MAQQVSEPLSSVALEGSWVLAPPSVALTSTVPPHTFHFQVQGNPGIFGHHLTVVPPESVTKSVTVTTTRASEAPLITPGLVTLDTPTAAASHGLGSQPFGQSVSLPLASGPS